MNSLCALGGGPIHPTIPLLESPGLQRFFLPSLGLPRAVQGRVRGPLTSPSSLPLRCISFRFVSRVPAALEQPGDRRPACPRAGRRRGPHEASVLVPAFFLA